MSSEAVAKSLVPTARVCCISCDGCDAVSDVQNQMADFLSPAPQDLYAMSLSGVMSTRCVVQAWFQSFFNLSSVLWTTAIAGEGPRAGLGG